MKVKTGFGYFTDNQKNIIGKYELPIGNHPLKEDYGFVEVASKLELDAIKIYEIPKSLKQIKEDKIQIEIHSILREQAITNLKAKGEIK